MTTALAATKSPALSRGRIVLDLDDRMLDKPVDMMTSHDMAFVLRRLPNPKTNKPHGLTEISQLAGAERGWADAVLNRPNSKRRGNDRDDARFRGNLRRYLRGLVPTGNLRDVMAPPPPKEDLVAALEVHRAMAVDDAPDPVAAAVEHVTAPAVPVAPTLMPDIAPAASAAPKPRKALTLAEFLSGLEEVISRVTDEIEELENLCVGSSNKAASAVAEALHDDLLAAVQKARG